MGETSPAGATGGVRAMLRLEGLMLLTASVFLYAHAGASWILFFALFLAPDLSFAGYLFGPRVGAIAYNTVHSTVGPIVLALVSQLNMPSPVPLFPVALIWFAHIGFDRGLGYGLKYASSFFDTHLGANGNKRHQLA